ncbi:MAG: outer membrane beta-barrel domain-containing protein [Myxococcota bacterium]
MLWLLLSWLLLSPVEAAEGPRPDQTLGVLRPGELAAVQKPLYPRSGRLELGVNTALIPNDAYVLGAMMGVQATWHLSPEWGAELSLGLGRGWDTYASRALQVQGVRVDAYSPVMQTSLDVVWTPIYAKLNLLGWRVVHFDVAGVAGGGLFLAERTIFNDTVAAEGSPRYNLPASLNLGLLHRYYMTVLGRPWALRLEVRDHLTLVPEGLAGPWLKHDLLLGVGLSGFLTLGGARDK